MALRLTACRTRPSPCASPPAPTPRSDIGSDPGLHSRISLRSMRSRPTMQDMSRVGETEADSTAIWSRSHEDALPGKAPAQGITLHGGIWRSSPVPMSSSLVYGVHTRSPVQLTICLHLRPPLARSLCPARPWPPSATPPHSPHPARRHRHCDAPTPAASPATTPSNFLQPINPVRYPSLTDIHSVPIR